MFKRRLAALAVLGLLVACGGKPPAPVTPDTAGATTTPTAPTPPTPPVAPTPPADTATPAKDPAKDTAAKYEDPHEAPGGGPITMAPLLKKGVAKSTFPKRTVGDKECWQGTALAGDAKKDFDTIIGKCGSATGLVEYAKPVLGKLHHIHDKRDTYKLKLVGGMCYRYFAVADAGIKDLDILVTKPNGALVADDKTTHPVAIIEFDKSWCADDDVEYDFHIEVDGEGTGNYVFGVWAKPKGM